MEVVYVDHLGSDLTVVNAARVSFNKHKAVMDESDEKLVEYLAKHNHWSPFSHASIQLRMKAPIFVARQLFKHKVGMTENEVSRRYVDDEPEFFVPDEWRGKPTNGAKQGSSSEIITSLYQYKTESGEVVTVPVTSAYLFFLNMAEELYSELICEGVAPEQARMVLPQSMYTEWYWTGSLASYARIYNLRSDPHAQKETQDIAKMIDTIIRPLFPVSWEALTSSAG